MRNVIAVLIVASVTPASPTWAQGRFSWAPSVSIAEVADSNVFSTPSSGESDFVTRTSPGVQAGYQSVPLQLVGRYTCDAERYRDHPQLNDTFARQQAGLDLRATVRRTTLTTAASYVTTHTPQELNALTGLTVQRAPAMQYSVAPSLNYQFNALTRGSVAFQLARSTFGETASTATGAPSIVTREFTVGVDRHLAATDVARARYRERSFDFGGAPALSSGATSRALLLGWTHDVSRLTQTTVTVGPRLSDGSVRPEVAVDVRRRLQSGDVALSFARTEGVALGEAGAIEVKRLTGSLTARPARRLELRAGPGVSRDEAPLSGLKATVYLLDVAATSPLTRWLSLQASYQRAWERSETPLYGALAFEHAVFIVRAVAAAPTASTGSGHARAAAPPALIRYGAAAGR
ncbi:MAG: outer membrane beta-barrel protein [Acidobacteria bacterium]|nr:outer membrane beta-barrel protein [Acidobacteriota bacterium]